MKYSTLGTNPDASDIMKPNLINFPGGKAHILRRKDEETQKNRA